MSIPDEGMQRTIQAAEELRQAIDAVAAAKARLDFADDLDLIDAAIYEMKAAEKRLSHLLKQINARHEEGCQHVAVLGRPEEATQPA